MRAWADEHAGGGAGAGAGRACCDDANATCSIICNNGRGVSGGLHTAKQGPDLLRTEPKEKEGIQLLRDSSSQYTVNLIVRIGVEL